jgi:hypothetical protein
MKKLTLISITLVLCITTLLGAGRDNNNWKVKNDTTGYTEINGKIVDATTNSPVVFGTVSIMGTSMATVSNADGEFVIKVPNTISTASLTFTHLGYQNKTMPISEFKGALNVIEVIPVTVTLDEVIIHKLEPISILLAALNRVKDNYSNEPEMQTSFYREAIKQNRNYVSVSEAITDIYKAPYSIGFGADRMKIYKGRKSSDVKKMDTLLVKLQGGPTTCLMLDVVKNPGEILDKEMFQYYNFKLMGVTTIDNRETYVLNFDQIDGLEQPLYAGNIYIDVDTKAFAGFDFGFSEKGLPYATEMLIKKKPSNLNMEVEGGHYLIKYQLGETTWHLNYVRSELAMNSKWKRKLFKTDINIMLEMAVTDRTNENIEKFTGKESAKIGDIFADQVSNFEDEDFWGDYNTIKPEESIEVAIEKLNKKVKRRQ